tara:strand:- start:3043 stop:3279 length:237 start_codon:yes stop_codon:yes gene_type:complete
MTTEQTTYLLKVLKKEKLYLERKLSDNLKYDEAKDFKVQDSNGDTTAYEVTFKRVLLDKDIRLLEEYKHCVELIAVTK